MAPKISIITISLNSERYIEQTITSVTTQSYKNIEYIIVDGGSTDGTLNIITKHESKIDRWITESDDGIADAMNKGICLATGDYIIFLHSDDYFTDIHSLSNAVLFLSKEWDIFLFNIFLSKNGKKKLYQPRGFNWWMNFKTGIFHQSAICSKELFLKIGVFDTSYHIAMDYDFFLRAYRAKMKTKKITHPLSVMRLCGVSSKIDRPSLKERLGEERRIHFNCTASAMRFLYQLYWLLYPIYKYSKSEKELLEIHSKTDSPD
ncbi:MAG: glycosyltransferase [Desulfobacterales bacterium]|nr:glycosyltransferase [Desulfobacterales bacterium]